MANWRLNDAQKHLDEVVKRAYTEGPQTIALPRGRRVVVSRAPSRRAAPKRTLRDVFGGVPLAEIVPPRSTEQVGGKSVFE